MTDTDLRDRLAKVLEPLLREEFPGSQPGLASVRRLTEARADRYLTDANAALALIEEHGPGEATFEYAPGPYDEGRPWLVTLSRGVRESDTEIINAFPDITDGISIVVAERAAGTLQEALMAAFVTWAESEASSG